MRKVLCIACLIAGIGIFLYPEINSWLLQQENAQVIEAVKETAAENTQGDAEGNTQEDAAGPSGQLWDSIQAYNLRLWEDGQAEFRDAWAVAQTPSELEWLGDEAFGCIEIPAMDVELPLYAGASTANMAKGAAILGATSIPVGGENTNCVIAAHRGYRGIPFFRDIEKLSVGDAVFITNPWGTLGYRVEAVDIIDPYDSDKVKIQAGRDMVTLMTCHPYRSHGKYRYVVYCVRDDSVLSADAQAGGQGEGPTGDYITASDGAAYETSQKEIEMETLFRRACGAALIIFFAIRLLTGRRRNSETAPAPARGSND